MLSSHDIGLRDPIESATLLGGLPHMFLIAVSIAADQAMGTELSEPVREAISPAVQQIPSLVGDLVGSAPPDPHTDSPLACGDENA